MTGYLVNFAVYTMAMMGLIFFALMVYKKFAAGGMISGSSKSRMLSIEETISIAPRKNLYIVKAGEERFLIAGDIDKTTLISKLGANEKASGKEVFVDNTKAEMRFEENFAAKDTLPAKKHTTEERNITPDTATISAVKNELKNQSSVDDLPIIVDFQKKVKQQPSKIQDMLKKING